MISLVLITIFVSLILVSLFEYLGHRILLHKTWFTKKIPYGADHLQHHKNFATQFEWAEEEAAGYDSLWVRLGFGFVWSLPISLAVGFGISWVAAGIFSLIAALHAFAWAGIHEQMHRPTIKWITNSNYFKRIRDFHLGHHQKPRTNFSFLFAPLWDWVFGTRKI